MTFKESIHSCIKKNYVRFQGRATRSEFWWFQLFIAIFSFVAALAGGITGAITAAVFSGGDGDAVAATWLICFYVSYLLVCVALFLPALAVYARRLHDQGKSAGFIGMLFIPIAGIVIAMIFSFVPSNEFDNAYGPYMPTEY